MKKQLLFILLIVTGLSATILLSRNFRVAQIPNGTKFSCANCHIDPFGGGPRNNFGLAVEQRVTPGGTQNFWNSSLASIDSDGDGFTNGQELQDPNGIWTNGSIGDFNKVTNPGDPSSKPNPTSVAVENLPNSYKLLYNYPNPFNPSTTITFEIPESQHVSLNVYNISGELIQTLVDKNFSAGTYKEIWDGKDKNGNSVSTGIYIYRMRAGQFDKSARMILLK